MTNISVLGSTGSIGTQTLDVLEEHKNRGKPGLEDIIEADRWAREYAVDIVQKSY